MLPFTNETVKVFGLLFLLGTLFSAFQFSFHPVLNIILKSMLMIAMYLGILYRFKISEDLYGLLAKFFKK